MIPTTSPRRGVVVSAAWTTAEHVLRAFAEAGDDVTVHRRATDWGKGRLSRALLLCRSVGSALHRARDAERLVLLTVGYEVFLAVVGRRLLRPRSSLRIVVVDFLAPRSSRLGALQGRLLRQVDEWVCIRRGDIESLGRRYGIDPGRCRWAAFPLSAELDELAAIDASTRAAPSPLVPPPMRSSGYVYSAGTAHRDWGLVLDALELARCPAVLAVDPGHPEIRGRRLPPGVAVVGLPTPDEGRRLAAGADVVVVALKDTVLPAGPLVLADALAMGKAVVATDVNGTRDYVEDGATALLVPAGDASAMAQALERVLKDEPLRQRLGSAAQAWAARHLGADDFVRGVLNR